MGLQQEAATDVESVYREGDGDPASLRRAYSQIPSAVALLAGAQSRGVVGMTVATLLPVSLHPPLLGVMIQDGSTTWHELAALPRIGVSVLAAGQPSVARKVASPDRERRFDGLELLEPEDGSTARLIAGAHAWFDTELVEVSPAGDHLFAQLAVRSASMSRRYEPLIFHQSRFRWASDSLVETTWPLDGVWQ